MSHKSIRLLIEDTVKSLRDDIGFDYGRTSDFNIGASNKTFPFVNLDLLNSVPNYEVNGVSNYQKSWLCQMAFYGLDKADSTPDQYQKLLDELDPLVDQFLNKLNMFTNQSDNLLIQSIRQDSFVKSTSAILTGFLLTFTLVAVDDFDYCQVNCITNSNAC